ncbi:hypothetical protein CDAR_50391 [Caerostris darwini]|uniref:Secreted protein n=1 Tax=Caerostris darwini TaxID=1538125 RepID=A0AAV4UXN7_9ARAC|nr:hypothetical protein CDAR_50391 [Caerostris darwini]
MGPTLALASAPGPVSAVVQTAACRARLGDNSLISVAVVVAMPMEQPLLLIGRAEGYRIHARINKSLSLVRTSSDLRMSDAMFF